MPTIKSTNSPGPSTDIDPKGDVLLVVGPDKAQFRVQSQCLRCASKVFGLILGDKDATTQISAPGNVSHHALPEDDADAMRTILYVIHHRNHTVSRNLTEKQILQIAIVASKYDLLVALDYASEKWLNIIQPASDMKSRGYLMAAAYLFRNQAAFRAHTQALVLNFSRSYLENTDTKLLTQFIPWKIFCEY
jgi:hypothetical protein